MGELNLDKIERALAPEWKTEYRPGRRSPGKPPKTIKVVSLRPETPHTVARINAQWCWLEDTGNGGPSDNGSNRNTQ